MSEQTRNVVRSVIEVVNGPAYKMVAVIDDETDDNAAATTAQWEAKEFDLDDLIGSTGNNARVTVRVNQETPVEMAGSEFYLGDPVGQIVTDDSVVTVTFTDLPSDIQW